jgi:hypothetical protein
MATLLFFVLLGLFLCVYFIPAFAAHGRRHRETPAITMLNLFLGWTFLGWVIALVWACTSNVHPAPGICQQELEHRLRAMGLA